MILALLLLGQLVSPSRITVDASNVLNRVEPAMYGSCIEDVNHEIYGGLYAQRIFGESFEEPGRIESWSGWRSFGGDWRSEGDGVSCSTGDGPMLFLQGKSVGEGEISAVVQVRKGEDGSAGLIVRASHVSAGVDNFDGYEIAFQAKLGRLVLSRHRHDYQPLQEAPAPISTGKAYRLRVVLKGSRIQVYLGDESTPRLDFTDTGGPLLSGSVALRPWHADCRFTRVSLGREPISLDLSGSQISGMWDAVGAATFELDAHAFNGDQCQKISKSSVGGLVGVANCGLNRWGISARAGREMSGRVSLRGDVGSATIALQSADGNRTYASQRVAVGDNWRTLPFHLKPSVSDPNCRFAVLFDKPGALWVDQAVLMDGDRFGGLAIRGDIARAIADERITFLRYGGTMVNVPGYRWKNMIGKPDQRPPYRGNWYPYSTNGFGIFDFLRFCEAAKLASAFAINIHETSEDAADLAEYLTGPVTSKWGAKRLSDGHPAPYHPDYIEIGNEEAIGSSTHADYLEYAERFKLLEQAMHSRDPHLKLVCTAWWVPESPDMKLVFDAVSGKAAAWDIHVWSDEPNAGEGVERTLEQVRQSFKSWDAKTNLKAVVFEENGNRHDLQRALGHATTLNATRRMGDFVIADCPANCLQPWQENDNGWDQGQIFFTPDRVWGMPPYYAQQMLADDRLPFRVASTSPTGIDVLATRSRDGKTVALTVVNLGADSIRAVVSLAGFHVASASAETLSGELSSFNSPDHPEKVRTVRLPVELKAEGISLAFPSHSASSVRVNGTLLRHGHAVRAGYDVKRHQTGIVLSEKAR